MAKTQEIKEKSNLQLVRGMKENGIRYLFTGSETILTDAGEVDNWVDGRNVRVDAERNRRVERAYFKLLDEITAQKAIELKINSNSVRLNKDVLDELYRMAYTSEMNRPAPPYFKRSL